MFSNCRITNVCYGSKNILTNICLRTNPDTDCMSFLINMYFRGFFLFAENKSVVGEFFSLIRLADLILSPVAGADFLIQ